MHHILVLIVFGMSWYALGIISMISLKFATTPIATLERFAERVIPDRLAKLIPHKLLK